MYGTLASFSDIPITQINVAKADKFSPQVPIARVQTMCKLLEVLLTNPNAPSMTQEKHKLNPILAMSFVFSLIWGLAGGTIDANWDQVDAFVRNVFDDVGDARVGLRVLIIEKSVLSLPLLINLTFLV
ncbi:hypothetical protein T265_12224 [Opisthorchis viverrini]|uniref:Dynein heavy chain AAA 5 extension domain-containing protein n=1 Tax=Opisthorchis viverrini TaxID=6198 RepID=A0A074ZTM6_OPIVI|nr:hypothetical protein T265_12224 [Opisthorchis viverrini]KER18589.1 hypothetical protein T265_12224 [Opisthorchis viverrini]